VRDLDDLVASLVDRAEGDESLEAFAVHSVSTTVSAYEAEVESLTSAETRGIGVRVIDGQRVGFASTSDLSADGLAFVVAAARANAQFGTPDPGNVLPAAMPAEPLAGIYLAALESLAPEQRVAAALDLERLTLATDPRVVVESATYGDARTHVAIASTNGVRAGYARTDCYAYVSALARDGDDTQTGLGLTSGRSYDELDLAAAAAEAGLRSTRLLGARKPATARVPVVFDPLVTASFLGVLAGALTAEAVQKGRSLFAERVGEQIAGAGLSIVDDGRLIEGPAAAPFDDEGVPTRRTAIVEDGVLRGFLHNTETAAREGGRTSTGNASRAGHASTPGVAPTNLFLDGGTTSRADLLARADGGLYVQDVSGIHSGVNPVSGEFSVGATGLWIHGGELGGPVREVTVSSTIVDMLRAVQALGDDRRFVPFGGSYGGATLLLGEMTVAGS
jgi:PmbA protein